MHCKIVTVGENLQRQRRRHCSGADAAAEQRLAFYDVAHARHDLLVEYGVLDGAGVHEGHMSHMSHVIYHMSHVIYHMSPVNTALL